MIDSAAETVIEVRGLRKYFPLRRTFWPRLASTLRAVDGVSFQIAGGETLGLVGESGCGKSTLGRAILQLIEPTGGEVVLRVGGPDRPQTYRLPTQSRGRLRQLRRHLQIVFQNPNASLNPRLTIGASLDESLRAIPGLSREERSAHARRLLDRLGLESATLGKHPHALSGGQLQRVAVARALATEPSFIVCDEVVSSLDVSVQGQVLNYLCEVQREKRIALLFVSHDLRVAACMSERVAVMYAGQLVEVAPTAELFQRPLHPYTRKLLASAPGRPRQADALRAVPRPVTGEGGHERLGCRYRARCPEAVPECGRTEPPLVQLGGGREVRCHVAGGTENRPLA